MALSRRAAVFLDKDGTLVRDVPYNVDPGRIRLMPRAADGLTLLREAGYRLVVVSNQSGVACGYFEEKALGGVHRHLQEMLGRWGVSLDGFYYCPHSVDGSIARYAVQCECRKPAPGMLRRAAEELGIKLEESWMIGDILNDVEAGNRAGCRTVLLDNGHETRWEFSTWRIPYAVAGDLWEAARLILSIAPRDRSLALAGVIPEESR
jgi:histidinol-phosphate phosphatase family protein